MQLSLRLLQSGRRHRVLRLRLSDCSLRLLVFCVGRIRIRVGIVVIVLGNDTALAEFQRALELGCRIIARDSRRLEVRPGAGQVCNLRFRFGIGALHSSLSRSYRGLRVFDLGLEVTGIQFRQELATLDDGVEVRIQRIHLSGNLASNLDRHDCLDDARGVDLIPKRSPVGRRSEELTAGGFLFSDGKHQNDGDYDQREDD